MKKIILGIWLVLCLALILLPALLPSTARAAAAFNNVMPDRAALDGRQESTIYFGTYPQTTDDGGNPVSGQTVRFLVNYAFVDDAMTGSNGVASLSYTIALSPGNHSIGAYFDGSPDIFNMSSGSGTLTVGDTTPPASPVYSPSDSATDVAVGVTPTLTFSEALYGDASGTPMGTAPTGVIRVYEGTSNAGTALTEGAGADNAHFTVTYDSVTYTFTVTFGAELKNSQSYYLELQGNSVYDAAGNAISAAEGITFTTASSLFACGTGTSGDPYEIATEEQLRNLAELVNDGTADPSNADASFSTLYYELTADIILNEEWTPIGTYANKFKGYFDGGGFVISGLMASGNGRLGLFGDADTGNEIKNVGLKDVDITASGSYVGGVVGNTSGSVSGCWVSGAVVSTSTMVGGVVGNLSTGGSITNCYATAGVSGSSYVGGVVGGTYGPVSFCYATGSVSGSGSSVGGIVGWRYYNTSISNCAALNLSVSGGSDVGRIIGGTGGGTGNLAYNVAFAGMTGGDFGADRGAGTINGADKTVAEIAAAESFWTKSSNNFVDDWYYAIWDVADGFFPTLKNFSAAQPELPYPFGGADGSDADNAYLISSEYQLRLLAIVVNAGDTAYNDKYYKLTAEIELNTWTDTDGDGIVDAGELANNGGSPHSWMPIGDSYDKFLGTFDGDGHTVSGVYIDAGSTAYQGLFGYLGYNGYTATVMNVGVTQSYISGGGPVGGVVGRNHYGRIENCYHTGSVCGITLVGGVVGENYGTVSGCYHTGSVTGTGDSVGGVAGYSADGGSLQNCYNTGAVSSTGVNVGGVVGASYSTVSGCYSVASASVSGENGVGGVAGLACGVVEDSYAACTVSGARNVGGAVGIAGDATGSPTVSISDCFASGAVTGGTGEFDQDAGGVIGFLAFGSTAASCYATGDVSGSFCVGGVVGQANGAVSNCYALGAVSGADSVGGVAGYAANNPLSNCVALNPSVSGTVKVGRVVGDLDMNVTASDTAAFMGMTGGDFGTERGAATKNGADLSSLGITNVMNERFGGNSSITSNPWTNCDFSDLSAFTGISSVPRPDHLYTVIAFDVNGGSSVSPLSALAGEDGKLVSLPEPSRDSYNFGGWYLTAVGSGDAVTVNTVFENSATVYAKWTANASSGGGSNTPARTITVTEVSSGLFSGTQGAARAEANMTNAFLTSVEVRVTDTDESASSFGLGAGNTAYPFDISLYIKGTNTKTQPKDGYAVTISLPVPEELLEVKEQLSVVHKADDGTVTTLVSQLKEIDGVWYLVFEATQFSPYALVVSSAGSYDTAAGLPYYLDAGDKVFIGFAANGKYIAPAGVTVLFQKNAKSFTDVAGHWAAGGIGFVTEREIFLGAGGNAFSPDSGMTRAMFATVIGRLYERSYGEIAAAAAPAFSDCDAAAYYGKYVDWAAENDIIGGDGGGFNPDGLIIREQMAAILLRFADYLGVLPEDLDTVLRYPDADSISGYAKDAALYCQTTGVITGRSGGMFAARETATRAEVAAIIQRFVESVLE